MSTLTVPSETRPPFFRSVSLNSHLSTKSSKSLSLSRTFSHRKDKLRLYLAVFSRGGPSGGSTYGSQLSCDSYHWALVIGPKSPLRTQAGVAYHIVHSSSDFINTPFFYEETDLVEEPPKCRNLLARITIAKILNEERVVHMLRDLAAQLKTSTRKDSTATMDTADIELTSLTCLTWVKLAWEQLTNDSKRPLKSYLGVEYWEDIESRARKYVKRKRQQGRYNPATDPGDVTWNPTEIPTWNFWENREITD